MIAQEPVMLFAMRHARCTMAAMERLESKSACFKSEGWVAHDEPLWKYMKCLHPHEYVGDMQMHSYVYIGGEYIGNGFALSERDMTDATLSSRLQTAAASLTCGKDCGSLASPAELEKLGRMTAQPLAMLGWASYPCTGIARNRFEGARGSVSRVSVSRGW